MLSMYFFKSTIYLTISKKWYQSTSLLLPLALALFCLSVPLFGLYNLPNTPGILLLLANLLFTFSTALVALLIFYLSDCFDKKKTCIMLCGLLIHAICFEVLRRSEETHARQALAALSIALIFFWPLLSTGKQLWQQHESIHLRFLAVMLFCATIFWFIRASYNLITFDSIDAIAILELLDNGGLRLLAATFNVFLMIVIGNRFFELSIIQSQAQAQNNEAQMLSSLNAISLARDNETGQHILRTQKYVKLLALRLRQLGLHTAYLDDKKIEDMYKAAPLHDVGKVGIPDHILQKKGRLDAEEWEIMKTHTTIGANVLAAVDITNNNIQTILEIASEISAGHHERWDGAGYPRGIKGEDIPVPARIMALADVYDALVSHRAYKAAWSHEEACKDIISRSGTQFDPQIVQAFVLEITAFQAIALKFQDPA